MKTNKEIYFEEERYERKENETDSFYIGNDGIMHEYVGGSYGRKRRYGTECITGCRA